MPRAPRITVGGIAYHVLNRSNQKATLFHDEEDYRLFLDILAAAQHQMPMRILGYCIMPNHWHLLLWPFEDGDLSAFMQWVSLTHTQRYHVRHGSVGMGHLYQGRFKSFPIQEGLLSARQRNEGTVQAGDPVLTVLRYIERNPVRAGLVTSADTWLWGSAATRGWSDCPITLTEPMGGLSSDWLERVNRPNTQEELDALKKSISRGTPFGQEQWVKKMASEWGMESTFRPRGRPKKRG